MSPLCKCGHDGGRHSMSGMHPCDSCSCDCYELPAASPEAKDERQWPLPAQKQVTLTAKVVKDRDGDFWWGKFSINGEHAWNESYDDKEEAIDFVKQYGIEPVVEE